MLSLVKILNMVTQEEQHRRMMIVRDVKVKIAAAFSISHGKKTQFSVERDTCKHYG